ncbi:MAG: aminotransferase class I/II-fold pyridoxal phosphate-dependent enzyme [Planctomycetes bacterium]|nr:aminotransferase class I/II-fold pyridoxal phosphate-dependent enzyme [Planctomycetota bacterium]
MRIVDLRSDTVTKPTPKMREAMRNAIVDDDVFGTCPTMNRLEEMAAEKVGKEAALFVASGVMGNLIATLVHTRPGDEVICDKSSHFNVNMTGGTAALAGITTCPLAVDAQGRLNPADVEAAIKADDCHLAKTRMVVFENTNNAAGGTVITPQDTAALAAVCRKHGLVLHMDGARVFNSAVAQGIDVKRLTADCSTVMFCISKGLGSPVGSLLTGPKEFIREARRKRKMLGGGMRQAGVLAACGIISLTDMIDRLADDHRNARTLAEGMAALPGFKINLQTVQTNIIYFEFSLPKLTCHQLVARLRDRGVLCLALGPRGRMCTHNDVNSDDISHALAVIADVVREAR